MIVFKSSWIRKFLTLCGLFLAVFSFAYMGHGSTPVRATSLNNPTVPNSCDNNFLTQMKSRATAEAQRDVMIAQTVVRKSDSVLQYTCFDQFINVTGRIAASFFSENRFWDSRSINVSSEDPVHSPGPVIITITAFQDSGSLTDLLGQIVGDVMESYIGRNASSGNFRHDFLGGTAGNITNSGGGGINYNCNVMQQVWQVSKCENFATDDIFTRLSQPEDLRNDPQACNNPGNAPQYTFPEPADVLDTKIERFNRAAPGSAGIAPTCENIGAIPTGRQVTITEIQQGLFGAPQASNKTVSLDQTEQEMVCILPGCSYNYDMDTCEE